MRLIKIAENFNNIIIYGAGEYGGICRKWMGLCSELVEKRIYVAVSVKSNEDEDVKEISEYIKMKEECLVIIATSEDKQTEIKELLKHLGFKHVYSMTTQLYEFMKSELSIKNTLQDLSKYTAYKNEASEILNGMIFLSAAQNCSWIEKKDFRANHAAVGYYYLYVLLKALDSNRFDSILDIGMGQTTKLISQYVRNTSKKHICVENDVNWIDFSNKELNLSNQTKIIRLETGYDEDCKTRIYLGFEEELKGEKFNIISIDGPPGYDMEDDSRVDILRLLPNCLKESFIIMIDDTNRQGESNTFLKICNILTRNKIEYCTGKYTGKKSFSICTSIDNKYYCSL
ncbi:hypothetical protein NXH64_06285 [Butyrivibrio fibrisolvens]|uniref:hypothetical protein n=1 Tax=Pseudobutyrivibrio ruminis TaxID=46206 RepID=UPI0004175F64|nr:hypothetical protein [Pseudobutyrivibrio ruminis]MDC7279114.1 hypothetical protein [Butyrivibrio fibrisolvens]